MRQLPLFYLLSFSMFFLPGAEARATPSFDCAKATSPLDTLVCDVPSLARADTDLAEVFHNTLASTENKPYLLETQRVWLKSRAAHCRLPEHGPAPSLSDRDDAAECVNMLYAQRIAALSLFHETNPTICNNRVELFVRAICNDPELRAAGRKLESTVATLVMSEPDAIHREQLRRDQMEWWGDFYAWYVDYGPSDKREEQNVEESIRRKFTLRAAELELLLRRLIPLLPPRSASCRWQA